MELFKCEAEKCEAMCCKLPTQSPFLDLKDLKNIADFLEKDIVDVWTSNGIILHRSDAGNKINLNLGIRYSPYCNFLKDDKCSIYEKRPFECYIFPAKGNFQQKNLSCLVDTFLPFEELYEKYEKALLHNKNIIATGNYLLGDLRIAEYPSEDKEITDQIYDSFDFLKANRETQLVFLATYLKMRNEMDKETIDSCDAILYSEYFFLKTYDRVINKLKTVKFDKENNPIF